MCQRLGWRAVWSMAEEINFYGHEGDDSWYYFAYGPSQEKLRTQSLEEKTEDLPKGPLWNGIDSRLTDNTRNIWGDVAVVRSGPSHPENIFSAAFNGRDLEATIKWYSDGRNVGKIYHQREQSRAERMYFKDINTDRAQYVNAKVAP